MLYTAVEASATQIHAITGNPTRAANSDQI